MFIFNKILIGEIYGKFHLIGGGQCLTNLMANILRRFDGFMYERIRLYLDSFSYLFVKVSYWCFDNTRFAKMNSKFALRKGNDVNVLLSAFSIATLPTEKLRPIQMLPHFDCPADNQFAMVHYLCDAKHGGTSIYRHNLTGYERINESRQSEYRQLLKQQAIAEKLHLNSRYIDGDTQLFTRVHALEAKINRAVIYPSNVLHSGNIHPEHGLSASPATGRLTISSFIVVN